MENNQSIVKLDDHFLVGSAESGHDFVQNMYGMYIRHEQGLETDDSNLSISNGADKHTYNPLISTSLGEETIESGQEPKQLIRIKRDYKDVLVSLWKTHKSHIRWKEFKTGPLGFPLITSFEESASNFEYSMEISYEQLVESPQQILTSVLYHLLPVETNPEVDGYGQPKKHIDIDCIDKVVDDSQVRSLREGNSSGLLDSVGIHKQFLTQEDIEEIDEFIVNL